MADQLYSDYPFEFANIAMDTLVKQELAAHQEQQQQTASSAQTSSASVPIPGTACHQHRGSRAGVYDQFSPSPLTNPAIWGGRPDQVESPFKLEVLDHQQHHHHQDAMLDQQDALGFKMEDDDIFQVDKADLIQGPTLAELNANDDTIFGDLNFDDLLLPEENNLQSLRQPPSLGDLAGGGSSSSNNFLFGGCSGTAGAGASSSSHFAPSNSFPQQSGSAQMRNMMLASQLPQNFQGTLGGLMDTIEPGISPTYSPVPSRGGIPVDSSTASSSTSPHLLSKPIGPSTLHELLMKKVDVHHSPVHSQMDVGPGASSAPKISRLSMSAPTQSMGLEQIWARREPRPHLLSTGSLGLTEAGSTSSLSTGGALSPNPLGIMEQRDSLGHDEFYEDSDDDSDHYEDYSSDNGGSDNEDQTLSKEGGTSKESKSKREKYFWQYNVQAKGPKGQRLVARARLEDPHVLHEVTDPVFSPHCALRGIKHSGKARKGDGNDLTPNPRKLQSIGKELDKLSRVINDMTPVSELPFPVRPKTRKEKNKLASRACRLKKKAQHEANKIKLHGLEIEHKRLINGISQAKQILVLKVRESNPENQQELTKQMEKVIKQATKVKIANYSTDFVNKVLDKVKAGVPDGGIDDFQ